MSRTWSVDQGLRRFSSAVFHPVGYALARVVTPNLLTTFSIFSSAAAGYCFATGRFVLGPWLMFLAGLFDIWDGQVAKLTNRISMFGAFYDSTADRVSDFVYALGALYFFTVEEIYDVAFMVVAYMVLSAMISYVKARAEGLGFDCNVGLLARPLRLLFFGIPLFVYGVTSNVWVFRAALYAVLLLSLETLIHRVVHVYTQATHADRTPAGG
ncbi:MAG: CDP-alcohol phosphatidyltransferase family protein [Actinomycetota bacterium]|nr:CDP-alcohol phosphatidyltransferase family protein [Actinomycetota bacterium]